ncbi:S1/P1 nuclease [Pedobacter fastidiosus]|uniref:S1/P1 nuclease n=1 Tax=Pedobacter fastidiosus TaxID=2765361 RepID=A0ABR7KY92_9SPHI|nr:S1/P1 nuclease [Pedobacter fastidiosus]MBC6112702.1 S1/P1 nuclease [Pedobacter fastidiosus]
MLKKIIIPILSLSFAILFMSWGVVGHRAIGKIAQNHLSKRASAAVKDLLGSENLAMVSTYPDEIRSYKQFAYTAPWHYVNLPEGLSYEDFTMQLKTMDKPNIYKAIINCIADLKDPSKSKQDKVFALKFLAHLVGDIHQPMHTGHSEDSGGNGIKIKLMRKEGNLHGLWDSGLIDYAGLSYNELATECDTINKKEARDWQKDEPTKWAFESYQITAQLYVEAAQNPEFDYDYYPKHSEIIKQRLAQAGLRLAALINEIYK